MFHKHVDSKQELSITLSRNRIIQYSICPMINIEHLNHAKWSNCPIIILAKWYEHSGSSEEATVKNIQSRTSVEAHLPFEAYSSSTGERLNY